VIEDWYRTRDWGSKESQEFERRLARARVHNRPQYLRIKAITLGQSLDPTVRAVARQLLSRVIEEYPAAELEIPFCHELLGNSFRGDGRLDEAEDHYRSCLRMMPESGSGTSGLCDLSLAELLTERGDPASLDEAVSILHRIRDHGGGRLMFNSQIFRFHVAWARVADRLGEREAAADSARRALETAEITEPQLARHPTVGLVDADPEMVAELRRLVGGS
jgi:hypothetical protein